MSGSPHQVTTARFGQKVGDVKALYELARTDGRYGLITMCIGGGQGIATTNEHELR